MEFDIEQGTDLADFIRAADKPGAMGDVAREVLADRPDLTPYEWLFQRIFEKLSTTRQIGMSPGPIPVDRIWAYCDRHNLSQFRSDIVERVILNMDAAFMSAYAQREKRRTAK